MDLLELSVEEKLKIVSGFLLESPPGEFNEVYNGTVKLLLLLTLRNEIKLNLKTTKSKYIMYIDRGI